MPAFRLLRFRQEENRGWENQFISGYTLYEWS